ncbi:MAG: hypothetical protein K9L02_05530 [Acholeplasmataceae bacterium]|nr:hypothetical protein [Acholeplasmataceae bacterium]
MNKYSKQIYENYQTAIKNRKSKIISFWSYFLIASVILTITSFFFYGRSDVFLILLVIFIIFSGFFLILVLMLLIFFVSEKPLYEILYPKVIEDHNYEEVTPITYISFPKDKDFFEFGGLYPSIAQKILRFKLSFENAQGYFVDVYDAYVVTSSGKTSHIHLNGYYFVFRDYSDLKFQVRTEGIPHVSPKYKRLTDIESARAFVDSDTSELDIKYIKLYNLIKNEYNSPSVAIGCNGNDLHIGITLRPMKRHVKVLTEDIYQELRRSLMQMIDLANTIK